MKKLLFLVSALLITMTMSLSAQNNTQRGPGMVRSTPKERVALITGGASGIGKAITLELAKNGAFIAINYNSSKTQAEELVEMIIENGGKAIAIQADVSDFLQAEKLVKEIGGQ